MRTNRALFIITTTLVFVLACQAVTPSATATNTPLPTPSTVPQPATTTTVPSNIPTAEDLHTDFVLILPPDAYNVTQNEDGSVSFLTNIPMNGVEIFYKTAYSDRGFGVLSGPGLPKPPEGCLKMFFSGDPSGRSIVVSGCTNVQTGELPITVGLDEPDPSSATTESEGTLTGFLLTEDAYNILDSEDGSVHFLSNMSFDEVENFYRNELPLQGYTERIVDAPRPAEGCFKLIFDGDPSGKALTVSGCILFQTEEMSVSIRLEDI